MAAQSRPAPEPDAGSGSVQARLAAAADLFPIVRTGADIGANHGLLACRLLRSGRARTMWVTDLSADALTAARQNIAAQGFTDQVRFSVGDGFSALGEPVDAAAVLGMGGQTIDGILRTAPPDRLPDQLVLSAHTQQELVRRSLYDTGYGINEERIVLSGSRYYVLIRARRAPGIPVPDGRLLFLGPCLTAQAGPLYRAYLDRRIAAYLPNRSAEGRQKLEWLKEEAQRAAADSPDRV